MEMTLQATVVLGAWIPVVLALFALLPGRRALLIAVIGGWLLLPMGSVRIPGPLPDLSKMTAIGLPALLGALLFDSRSLLSFRPRLIDLPMVLWCVWPLPVSVNNGLGVYDGASAVVGSVVAWGVPYLLGRCYFTDLAGLRELAVAIVVGGMIYVPLCVFEMRMSPKLHDIVYGFSQGGWDQTRRFEGWRPKVFMRHGLMVSIWMATASLLAWWLWTSGSVRRICGMGTGMVAAALSATTVMCRSVNGVALLAVGVAALLWSKWTGTRKFAAALALVPVLYMGMRMYDLFPVSSTVEAIARQINPDRAASVKFRFDSEDLLVQRALQRPVFGWGGWGRFLIFDEWGRQLAIPDGFWVLILGSAGLGGLALATAMFLSPAGQVMARVPGWLWLGAAAPATGLAVAVLLQCLDNLMNAMVSPTVPMMVGALASLRPIRVVVAERDAAPVLTSPGRLLAGGRSPLLAEASR